MLHAGPTPKQLQKQLESCSKIPNSNHAAYQAILDELQKIEINPAINSEQLSSFKLILLSDTVHDKGVSDKFILKLFERFEAIQMPFEIIFSNHDG